MSLVTGRVPLWRAEGFSALSQSSRISLQNLESELDLIIRRLYGKVIKTDVDRIYLPAMAMDTTNISVTKGVVSNRSFYWNFANLGGQMYLGTYMPKPEGWDSGKLAYRLWIAQSGTDTNDFRVNCAVFAYGVDDLISAGDNLNAMNVNQTLPGVANDPVEITHGAAGTSLDSDHKFLGVRCGRDQSHASDTSASDMRLMGLEIQYVPD